MSAHDHPHPHDQVPADPAWKHDGVRVVPGNQLDPNTAQTPGMDRKAAINLARVGAQKLWAGTVTIHANAKTGAHHHGHLESVIYIVKGRARMRWGEQLEFTAEAGPGDFIYVPPYVPHQEINASPTGGATGAGALDRPDSSARRRLTKGHRAVVGQRLPQPQQSALTVLTVSYIKVGPSFATKRHG